MLSFIAPPDFEAPGDVGLNNVYDVIVSASDGNGGLDTQAVQITVTDDPSDNGSNADPVITSASSASVVEGTTIALDVDATDADLDPITFGFGGGVDDALFSIDPSTGVLSFIAPPDFEAPGDVGLNNVYDVIVSASDGNGGLDTQAVQISVTDDPSDNGSNADPVITSASSASVVEGTTIALDVDATDADLDPITFGFGGGADDALFAIDPSTGVLSFLAPPDFEAPGDVGLNNVYDVIVSASDGNGGLDTQAVQITVTDDPSDNGGGGTGPITVGLIDAVTDQTVATFTESGSIDPALLSADQFAFEALIDESGLSDPVESVFFSFGGALTNTRNENLERWASFGNSGDNFGGETLPANAFSLTVEAYSANNSNGILLASETFDFTLT